MNRSTTFKDAIIKLSKGFSYIESTTETSQDEDGNTLNAKYTEEEIHVPMNIRAQQFIIENKKLFSHIADIDNIILSFTSPIKNHLSMET